MGIKERTPASKTKTAANYESPFHSMDSSVYFGLGIYELREIRDDLQQRIRDFAKGKALEAVTINGQNTQKRLLSIEQIRKELSILQQAIANHPDALDSDKPTKGNFRRMQVSFRNSAIC